MPSAPFGWTTSSIDDDPVADIEEDDQSFIGYWIVVSATAIAAAHALDDGGIIFRGTT